MVNEKNLDLDLWYKPAHPGAIPSQDLTLLQSPIPQGQGLEQPGLATLTLSLASAFFIIKGLEPLSHTVSKINTFREAMNK